MKFFDFGYIWPNKTDIAVIREEVMTTPLKTTSEGPRSTIKRSVDLPDNNVKTNPINITKELIKLIRAHTVVTFFNIKILSYRNNICKFIFQLEKYILLILR